MQLRRFFNLSAVYWLYSAMASADSYYCQKQPFFPHPMDPKTLICSDGQILVPKKVACLLDGFAMTGHPYLITENGKTILAGEN